MAKQRYLESGNNYFAKGKYREASIMYRNALQKDQKFGEAYYHLALAQLRLGQVTGAVGSLRRAIELVPASHSDHWDAAVRLSELYLALSRDKNLLDDVESTVASLLKRDPDSADGHRLNGDLAFVRAQVAAESNDTDTAHERLTEAVAEYRKADAARPNNNTIRLGLARSLAMTRSWDEAESIYRGVIDHDKTFVPAYTELYRVYLMQGKLDDAESILKRAFSNNPRDYGLLTALATHYYGLKRQDDTVRVLNRITSHAKDYPAAHLTVGDFYLRMGDGGEAIHHYKQGIEADARQKTVYQKRIIEVLMRQGKVQEAADLNAQILKTNPKDNDARGLAASLLLDRGEIQRAIGELQAVVSVAPDNFVARYNLGRAHMARRETEQARQQYREAIRINPRYIPARLALAQIQAANQEFDTATKSIEEILKLDPNNTRARAAQSSLLIAQGKFAEATVLLQAMRKAHPNSSEPDVQLGVIHLSRKEYKAAEETFRKAYEADPLDTRGLSGLVECYLAEGRSADAIQFLQAESGRFPARSDIRLTLANTAVRSGKFDLGLAEYQKALAGLPPGKAAAEIYLRMGETYRRKGDLSASIDALRKAARFVPDSPMVLSTLAIALDAAGRKSEARQTYEQTIKVDPGNAVALNNLAFLLVDTGGDLNIALTYAQKAKQLLPNLYEVSDTLGWIYLKKNLNDDAVQIFQELVNKQPNYSTYRYHLGMALSQRGDRLEAVKQLQQALKENPPKDEETKIRELIAKLG